MFTLKSFNSKKNYGVKQDRRILRKAASGWNTVIFKETWARIKMCGTAQQIQGCDVHQAPHLATKGCIQIGSINSRLFILMT